MSEELKDCPFCGSEPVFPEAKDVFGTFYDAGCENCGIPTMSLQIIDFFDRPRNQIHDSWNYETNQYGVEYIEVVRKIAINDWNTRHIPEGCDLSPELKESIDRIAENARWCQDTVIDGLVEWLCKEGHQGSKFRSQVERYKSMIKAAGNK